MKNIDNIDINCNIHIRMKKCNMCLEAKPLNKFGNFTLSKDGKYPLCKKCVGVRYLERRKQLQEYYIEKKKKINKQKYNKYKLNPLNCKSCNNAIKLTKKNAPYYARKMYCSDKCRQEWHRKNNPKYKKQYCRSKEYRRKIYYKNKQYYAHESECNSCGKKYIKRSSISKYCSDRCRINVYRNNRYKKDLSYRVETNLRAGLNRRVRDRSSGEKTPIGKFENLIGCSIDKLMSHLESKFKDGMSWENYGYNGWHVDHIKPCALFDLTDISQREECFHYTNLQPLWAKENMAKSNKYISADDARVDL